jgi:hypothetical protein
MSKTIHTERSSPRPVRSESEPRLFCRYLHAICVQAYWSLRLHYWLRQEKRALAKLQSVGIVHGAGSLPGPAEEATLINEVAEKLRFQPLLFGDGTGFMKSIGKSCPSQQVLAAYKALAGRKTQLIAEYDAHFLASIRIKPQIAPPQGHSYSRLSS